MKTWLVRAGQGGAFTELFLNEKCVGIDFWSSAFEQPPIELDREQLTAALKRIDPDLSRGRLTVAAGQLYRFLHEFEPGHEVLTYDPTGRIYYFGTLRDGAAWNAPPGSTLPTRRSVKWTGKVPRDALSVSTRNTLGSILTLFLVNEEAADELRGLVLPLDAPEQEALPKSPPVGRDAISIEDLRWENVEKSHEFIEDVIAKLDPYELQDLVAGILRAMGYKTRVSPPGSDRGVDIFASRDGLGLEEPRIFVEVKQRPSTPMGSSDLRSFLGGRKVTDRCLYVSTGGFTKDARYEAERAAVPLTLIDLPALRELLLTHYDALDAETTQLVPLTRVYWPIQKADD